MHHLHQKLSQISKAYAKWHQNEYHQHHHWLVVFVAFIFSFYAVVGAWQVSLDETNRLVLSLNSPKAKAQSEPVGADGITFSQRRQAWLNSAPYPDQNLSWTDEDLRKYLFAWLDKGEYTSVTSDAIQYLIGSYWFDGIRAQGGYAAMITLKYGQCGDQGGSENIPCTSDNNLISSADEADVKNRIKRSITDSDYFGHLNPNKQIYAMVGTYLYATYYDSNVEFPIYGYPVSQDPNNLPSYYNEQWPSFSYNGHTYTFGGGPYNAQQLAHDWLMWRFDGWYAMTGSFAGQREFDSIDYSRAFVGAPALLWAFTPDSDSFLKTKAKMATDMALLDSVLDISANSWGGTMGRADYYWTKRSPVYPYFVFFGLGEDTDRFDVRAMYEVGYEPPPVIIDLGILDDESDSYWHFHQEYNPNWLLQDPDYGKWNFVTKNYNIGSNVGQAKRGWQAVVAGDGRKNFIRFWVNSESSEPDSTSEGAHMGNNGNQLKNAIFAEMENGSKPYLWERRAGSGWDLDESEGSAVSCTEFSGGSTRCDCNGSCLMFRKLNKSMVAIHLSSETAGVEIATEGVEYSSWLAFKSAVRATANLTNNSYRTSWGSSIGKSDDCGLSSPGDCNVFPFERMNTVDNNGNKITEWLAGNQLKVSRHGKSCTYDFNDWTYSGDCGAAASAPPSDPVCSDGIDNDNDGLIDFPADPGCTDANDTSEDDNTVPPSDSVCSDGIDNDNDGLIDFPADPGCTDANDTSEDDNTVPPVSACTGGGTAGLGGNQTPDLTNDGCVDDADLAILLSCWGYTSSTAPSNCLGDGSGGSGGDTGGGGSLPPSSQPGDYPLIGWQTFCCANNDFYARHDLLVYKGSASRTQAIKQLNPNIRVIWTFDWNVADSDPDIPPEWFLRDINGNIIQIYGGFNMINLSEFVPVASSGPYIGLTYPEYVRNRDVDSADLNIFDGWGTDGVWGESGMRYTYRNNPDFAEVDINNNGINDHNEFTEDGWVNSWQNGINQIIQLLDTELSNAEAADGNPRVLILNTGTRHTWGWNTHNGSVEEHLNGYFDDIFNSDYWWDFASNSRQPWTSVADGWPYPDAKDLPSNTKNDFRGMRFGLAGSMFNDIYFSFQSREAGEHYWTYWYDEFDANLGKPLGSAQQIRSGVWARFFDNGVVIASTDGNPQTVTDADLQGLSDYTGPYYRFLGGQDPLHNNGQQFDSVFLDGERFVNGSVTRRLGDAIILFNQPTTVVSDIIIDNVDMGTSPGSVSPEEAGGFSTGWTQQGGTWGCNVPGTDYYSLRCSWNPGTYVYANTASAGETATFTPTIGVAGNYEIFEWHPNEPNACSQVDVSVNGQSQPAINQTINFGQWNSLGVFNLPSGTGNPVVITSPGGCTATADAFMFRYVGN